MSKKHGIKSFNKVVCIHTFVSAFPNSGVYVTKWLDNDPNQPGWDTFGDVVHRKWIHAVQYHYKMEKRFMMDRMDRNEYQV